MSQLESMIAVVKQLQARLSDPTITAAEARQCREMINEVARRLEVLGDRGNRKRMP
jgi:hypothetical protein